MSAGGPDRHCQGGTQNTARGIENHVVDVSEGPGQCLPKFDGCGEPCRRYSADDQAAPSDEHGGEPAHGKEHHDVPENIQQTEFSVDVVELTGDGSTEMPVEPAICIAEASTIRGSKDHQNASGEERPGHLPGARGLNPCDVEDERQADGARHQ